MKVLNLYYTSSGNTEKVAKRIEKTVRDLNHEIKTVRISSNTNKFELLDYDFIFAGSGVYRWLPGKPVIELFEDLREKYSEMGEIKPGCPKRMEKKAVIYCTYGGVHTGKNEAIPAVKFIGQLFDHLGFIILDEWYIVGEYPESMTPYSRKGRLGDIRGRPNEQDLKEIEEKVRGIITV